MIATNDIRLNALSQEIRELFYSVTYGDVNMEDLEQFVIELKENNNFGNLKQAIKAYNDLPKYLATKYKNYIDQKNTGLKIWLWKPYFLVIDTLNENKKITINFVFSVNSIIVFLGTRGKNNTILEEFKNHTKDNFIFEKKQNRYEYIIQDILDFNEHENLIDTVLNNLLEYIS